ncbi:MAG TPA: exodeoxyribonuclease III [Myxococcaceae bacterium]|nr:exodeoxyribonuclease III [Myxococcaceae bacterium]
MRVVTLNVNGIRSAAGKGLVPWLSSRGADVICLQEIRAAEDQLPPELRSLEGFQAFWHCGPRKGYSGVALLSRTAPQRVACGIDHPEVSGEGRVLRAEYPELSVISLYVPSGIMGPERQAQKMRFLEILLEHLTFLKSEGRELIICGDFNIAHRPIDIYNPVGKDEVSGYRPEERAWMDALLERGFVDAFRSRVGERGGEYTWWSNFRGARAKNLGWRLDYQITTPWMAQRVQNAAIDRQAVFSDHAPLIMDYQLSNTESSPCS